MIQIIVQQDDAGMAANVGGHVLTTHRTFTIDAPELEAYLKENINYTHRQIIGWLPDKEAR
jgi:hypothetical protein